jgi:uncharacterized phage-associated protein
MTVSAHDVARELRQKLPWAGDVKIHKLLYYCQGWHLARHGTPMFEEGVEAWANGPVIADLWRDEKYDNPQPDPGPLNDAMVATIELVLSRYGNLTGKALIELTHSEPPWRAASDRDDPAGWDDQTISPDLLSEFFTALDGHEAYSCKPFEMTPERKKIIDEARARARR